MEAFSALLALCAGNSPVLYRFEIWQAHRQQCCRCACQISKRYDNLKYQSRGFEILRKDVFSDIETGPRVLIATALWCICIIGQYVTSVLHLYAIVHWNIEAETKWPPFSKRHFQMIFLMKMYEFRFKFHWSLFPGAKLTMFQHWFR